MKHQNNQVTHYKRVDRKEKKTHMHNNNQHMNRVEADERKVLVDLYISLMFRLTEISYILQTQSF